MLRTQISLTEEHRRLLDAEAFRTGRSISALIRDAVTCTYAVEHDAAKDLEVIDASSGAWRERDKDGESYVDDLRSGDRLDVVGSR